MVTNVKGYECRMSPSLEYHTELSGSLDDKTTIRIASLDFDFMERISAWVKEHYPDGELYGAFSRDRVRAVEYVDKGRYRYVLSCAQNKKGIAAKRALWSEFFDELYHRKDMTPEQEKTKVLEDIKCGIAQAQTAEQEEDTLNTIYRNPSNNWLYRVSPEPDKKGEYHIEYLDPASSVIWKMDVRAAQGHPRKESVQSRLKYLAEQGGWILGERTEPSKSDDSRSEPKDDQGIMTEDGELFPNGTECRRHVLARAWKAAGHVQAIHVCDDQPDDVKIWLNTAEPAEYWVLNHDGEVCGERIKHCPYCEENLEIGCGDVLLAPIQIASPTSSDAATAAANQPAAAQAVSDLASMTEETAVSSNDLQDTAVGSNLAGAGGLPSFDYSGLDDQTVADLHLAEREYLGGRKLAEMGLRRMADGVAIAHDTLCGTVVHNVDNSKHGNRGEESFRRWCESMQIGKSTAYKLLQVSTMFDKSTPREQKVLEELSPSLLYAAAKPSAPAELVQAVKDGDITTHKQYQELLEKYKSEQQARQAERESTSALLRDEQQRRQKADEARIMAEKKVQQYLEIKDAALETAKQQRVKAADAEARAIAAEKKARELESRPVEVAVQEPTEEQIAAAAKQRTAMLEAQVRSLQADKDSALRQLDELGNTAYMTAAEFADNAARTVDSIRTAFWALAKELSGDDFAEALAPLDEAVRKIYEREWDDEESET